MTSPPTDGRQERVMFDKITSRIQKLCYGLNADFVDPVSLSFVLLSCSLPLGGTSAKSQRRGPAVTQLLSVAKAERGAKYIHKVFLLLFVF